MNNLNLTLPETFEDAREAVLHAFNSGKRILEGPYDNAMVRSVAQVQSFHVKDDSDKEKYGNLMLTVTYLIPRITEHKDFKEVPKTRRLYLLSTAGDRLWTVRTKTSIWDNNYPSTVAIDVDTREVFFFGIKASVIELLHFATLTEDQLNQLYDDLNEREPFAICIDAEAMFEFIDGLQGLAHLKKNLYIEFNCAVKIRLDMLPSTLLVMD